MSETSKQESTTTITNTRQINMEEVRALIKASTVTVGDSFKSFNDFCRHLKIAPPASTNKRAALKRELERWFDISSTKHSNKISITATHYDKPKIKKDNRKGLHDTSTNLPIQYLIILTELGGLFDAKIGYTMTEILVKIGLLVECPNPIGADNASRISLVYERYIHLLYRYLRSAMTQLTKKELVQITDAYINNDTKEELTDEAIKAYQKIESDVLQALECNSIQQVYSSKQIEKYWRLRKLHTIAHFDTDKIVHVYRFNKNHKLILDRNEYIKEALRYCDPHEILHFDLDNPGKKENFYASVLPINAFWHAMKTNKSRKKLGKGGTRQYLKDMEMLRTSSLLEIEKTKRGADIPMTIFEQIEQSIDRMFEEKEHDAMAKENSDNN